LFKPFAAKPRGESVGEELTGFRTEFNRSIRIEDRPERLTAEVGAIALRDVMERLEIVEWLVERLEDPRRPDLITHPLSELLRTSVLLMAQGWRDQDDADVLRDDAAMRLAVSDRSGVSPLEMRPREPGKEPGHNPPVPDGLASQPTLSRLMRMISAEANRPVLREGLLELAARRFRSGRGGHRIRYLTVDVDSLPIEVQGHQPGSEHNGHYHARIYHPLVASVAETGDLLDLRLRPGNVHTADGALEFIENLVDRVEEKMCQVAAVRIDAGFPEEQLLAGLERRRTPYVARVKNNAVLDRMAMPHLKRPPGRPPTEPRVWFHEMTYQAGSWSRERRVVLVVLERPSELFLHHFWLITNWDRGQMSASDLLEMYRQRGTAEGYMGELMSVLAPALSSSPRPKQHYRGNRIEDHTSPTDSFAVNEALLLLNALAYNVLHVARVLMEEVTEEGWSLARLRERVLRVPGRVLVHARRATIVIGEGSVRLWGALLSRLSTLRLAET
jgi:hypothetical protein